MLAMKERILIMLIAVAMVLSTTVSVVYCVKHPGPPQTFMPRREPELHYRWKINPQGYGEWQWSWY